MRRLVRDESGSALLAAIVLMLVMLGVGLAVAALSDNQEQQAATERIRESSFGFAEATLNAQVTRLNRIWPSSATTAFPLECTPTAGTVTGCPDAATLTSSFEGVDNGVTTCPGTPPVWRSTVRDNGGTVATYYRSAGAAAQPSYDFNKDGLVWVRAEGRAKCRLRTLVTLVRANEIALAFPRLTISANWFWTNNTGRKVIVDTTGSSAQPPATPTQAGPVQVRCVAPFPSPCLKVDNSKGQVGGSTPTQANMEPKTLTDEQAELVKTRARMLPNAYFPAGSCPPNLTGPLVYIEDATTCPAYSGGNTAAAPGMVVFGKGGLTLNGNRIFFGLLYARNENNSQDALIRTNGNSLIQGAVAVDGLGGVIAGASAKNIVFDPRVFSLVKGLGDASPVPGTWRELSPSE